MKDVDRRPEQIVEVGLQPGVLKGRGQGVEDVGDGAADVALLRQGPRVGLVLERAVAEELKFVEQG